MSEMSKKRKVGDAVLEALDAVRAELDQREQELERREEALQKAVDGVALEKQMMAGRTPGDVLALNCGGTKIQVLRKTLTQYDKSMLAARFSGRWDDSIEKDAEGAFFIDQPAELMIPLINFLRARAIETPGTIVPPPQAMESLHPSGPARLNRMVDMVEHFGMTPFVYQQRLELHRGKPEMVRITNGVEPSAEFRAFSTLVLSSRDCQRRRAHERTVRTFKVVLGDSIERPQIGWAAIDPSGKSGFKSDPDPQAKGPGEEGDAFALDGFRGGVLNKGQLLHEVGGQGLVLKAGSVVLCERAESQAGACFRWIVDGELVAEVASPQLHTPYSWSPVVAAKGQLRVSQFEYF